MAPKAISGPTAAQSQANKQCYLLLCESIFKKGKEDLCNSSWESEEWGVKNSLADTKVSEERGQEVLIPLQPRVCRSPCCSLWSRWIWPERGCGLWRTPQEQTPGWSWDRKWPWRSGGDETLGTDHNPHSLCPCTAEGEEMEEGGFRFVCLIVLLLLLLLLFVSHCFSLLVIGNKFY